MMTMMMMMMMMNVSGLLESSQLPEATRRMQDLWTRIAAEHHILVTKNRNDDDNDDESGSQSKPRNEKLACLHRRLITARGEAAALVFRLDSSSSSLPKNGDDHSSTADRGLGADSARCGSVISMDELELMTTLDDIERDLYGICGGITLHENDDIGIDDFDVDVIIDASDRSSICCPDEAAGGKRGLLDIDDASATLLLFNEKVVRDATPTPCTLPPSLSSSTTAAAAAEDTDASTQQLLRRLDEWETLNAASTAKVRAKEQEQTGRVEAQLHQRPVDDRDSSSSSLSSSSSSCSSPVGKSSRRRSVAMVATVKSLREKLRRNVSSSLDSFRAETAAMYNEVVRLRHSEQLLTERIAQQQKVVCELRAANDALQVRLRVAEASLLLRPHQQQQQSNGQQGPINDGSVRNGGDDDDDYTLSFGETTTADIDEHYYYSSSNPSALDQLFSQPLRQLTMHHHHHHRVDNDNNMTKKVELPFPRECNIPLNSGHVVVVPKETISFDHAAVVVGRSNGTV